MESSEGSIILPTTHEDLTKCYQTSERDGLPVSTYNRYFDKTFWTLGLVSKTRIIPCNVIENVLYRRNGNISLNKGVNFLLLLLDVVLVGQKTQLSEER